MCVSQHSRRGYPRDAVGLLALQPHQQPLHSSVSTGAWPTAQLCATSWSACGQAEGFGPCLDRSELTEALP